MGSFDDYKSKIKIEDIADYLGYIKVSSPNARHLEYVLGSEDVVVIYPQKNTYFSRKGNLDDKGDLLNFVLHRLDKFSNTTQTGFKGVDEVLKKYLGQELNVNRPIYNKQLQTNTSTFDIKKYAPVPLRTTTFNFLHKKRHLSEKTINDFSSKLHIYSVGEKDNAGFPYRKPGQMEIVNFEMRNYNPETNVNFKGLCLGGDKSHSCWIANFVPFDKVTDLYLFESAIDGMSFYEINHFSKETTSAFISTGGNVTKGQIEGLRTVFKDVAWHCCFDKDGSGNGFDVTTAYYLSGEDCKAFKKPTENGNIVYISFPTGETLSWKENEFSSIEFLKLKGKDNVIDIIKPAKYKDWNELLVYYKRFDLNLGPGMKFLPAIEETMSQLNLRGYYQLSEMFATKGQELIESLNKRSTYNISAPLAETNVYTLMVDCNIFMGIDTIVPIPNNLYIIDKTTQSTISALSMNNFLKKECINIFRDLHSNDLKKMLEKQVLTYTKGNFERNFERIVSSSGWGLKECTALKKENFNFEIDL